ncbi:MAG: ABC transporter substrate-binding protein [Clostridiaceae bacterium]|nr:ABC transporter substrate-binding protein [Clostridiaceae bacterium]
MKERIYTIPINEAFDQDTECPICICERKLEHDALDYTLGPSMMEPDSRIETNRTGFCHEHFTKLYNFGQNKLPLALIIDTHMIEQINELEKIYKKQENSIKKESKKNALDTVLDAVSGKKKVTGKILNDFIAKLDNLEQSCAVCDRFKANMDKLLDNTLYLYDKEPEFKRKFINSKGFCLKHIKSLLIKAGESFSQPKQAELLLNLIPMELEALKRVQGDVNHFTKMFDYRNKDADWKNSRDAVPRSIEKLCGPCELD